MADTEKKVLIDIQIDAIDALKSYTALKTEVDRLRQSQKELDKSTEDGRLEFERIGQQIRALNTEANKYQKTIQNNIREVNQEEGSLQQLKAQLSLMTAEYNNLGEARRKGAEGAALIKSINETTDAIKEGEEAVQNYRRSVGDYENSIKNALSTGNPFVDNILEQASSAKGAKGAFDAVRTSVIGFGKALLSLLANPIVLTIAAIVGVVLLLVEAFKRNEDNATKLNVVIGKLSGVFNGLLKVLEPVASFLSDVLVAALEMVVTQIEFTLTALSSLLDFIGFESAARSLGNFTNEIIKTSRAAGELAQKEADLVKMQRQAIKIQKDYQREAEKLRQLRDDGTKSITERIAANEELGRILQKQLSEELRIAQTALNVANLRIQVEGETAKNLDAQAAALSSIADIQERITGQESEQLRNASTLRKEAANNAYESYNNTLELKKQFDEAMIRAEADYQSEDFAKRQEYERRLFNLNQQSERTRLDNMKRFGKLTQAEYDSQLSILSLSQTEFNNSQAQALNNYYAEQRKNIFSLIDETVDAQIKEVERKYEEAAKSFNMPEPVRLDGQSDEDYNKQYEAYMDFMLEKALYETELEKDKAREIEAIRENSILKQASAIENGLSKEYENDLARYSDNERKKTEILIEQLQRQIEAKKAAGLDTYEDEAALRSAESELNQIALNADLLQAGENARAKYELRKAYLEQEQEIYKDNADKQLEIASQLADNEKELLNSRLESFAEWSDATIELLSGINSFANGLDEAELESFNQKQDEKLAKLESNYNSGFISEQEYEKQKAELQKEGEKKEAEIRRKQAIRDKAMSAFQIGVDTAMGVAKAVAASPLTFGLPWSAFVAATGALQLAAVLAKPIPKAARGRLITGRSHAMGGEIIEAEAGEVIINRRSTKMFAPLLSAINQAGGGIPFVAPLSDGGFTSRSVAQPNSTLTKADIVEAMKELKLYLALDDFHKANKDYTEIEDFGKIN